MTDQVLAALKARGVLKVIAQKDEAPEMISFAGSGEPGFEREIAQGFARLHDLKVQAVPAANAEERITLLNKGQGDVIIGIIVTDARKKLVDFTTEVLPARQLVITWQPHRVVSTLEEFRAEKVGVVRGTSWSQAALTPASRPTRWSTSSTGTRPSTRSRPG